MIFSHRSGETMDDAIADLCIGFGGDFFKTGIYGRERLIKLRRVIEIEIL
jgi:enolase